MTDRNSSGLDWGDAQWNLVVKAVTDEARRARVAGAFLPTEVPLSATTTSVPNFRLSQVAQPAPPGAGTAPPIGAPPRRLQVNSDPTLMLTKISALVYVRGSDAADPELAGALGQFRRAANLIARAEDALMFRGQAGAGLAPLGTPPALLAVGNVTRGGISDGFLPFGLPAVPPPRVNVLIAAPAGGNQLVTAISTAVTRLENAGHFGPFACVLSNPLFTTSCTPNPGALVLPRDRMLPFLEAGLFRSSAVPAGLADRDWGVVVALGGTPLELVLGADICVEFLQVTTEPRYVFQVSERLALRTRELGAIAVLHT
jgi:uncharacterized linocin/CFP29 family protein